MLTDSRNQIRMMKDNTATPVAKFFFGHLFKSIPLILLLAKVCREFNSV